MALDRYVDKSKVGIPIKINSHGLSTDLKKIPIAGISFNDELKFRIDYIHAFLEC